MRRTAAAMLVAAVHIATAIVIGLVPASLRPASSVRRGTSDLGGTARRIPRRSVAGRSVGAGGRLTNVSQSPECGRRLRLNGDRRGPERILQSNRKTDGQTDRHTGGYTGWQPVTSGRQGAESLDPTFGRMTVPSERRSAAAGLASATSFSRERGDECSLVTALVQQ